MQSLVHGNHSIQWGKSHITQLLIFVQTGTLLTKTSLRYNNCFEPAFKVIKLIDREYSLIF